MTLYCLKCSQEISFLDVYTNSDKIVCSKCGHIYLIKNGTLSLIERDVYWGEFSEKEMDYVLSLCYKNQYNDSKKYIIEKLKRGDFVWGKSRTDFMYFFDLKPSSVCLDVGCGLGAHSFNIAPYVEKVFGMDQSLKRVRFCNYRKKFEETKNVEFFHSDLDNIPFPDDYFDCIILNGVVEWLGEVNKFTNPRADQVYYLKLLHKKLKPGGQIYIGIENRMAPAYLKGIDHSGLPWTNFLPRFLADITTKILKHKSYRTYTYTKYGYNKLIQDSGFALSRAKFYIAHPGYNLPQFIVQYEDLQALRFLLNNMAGSKGFKGKIICFMARSDFFLKLFRHLFYSYLIFLKK